MEFSIRCKKLAVVLVVVVSFLGLTACNQGLLGQQVIEQNGFYNKGYFWWSGSDSYYFTLKNDTIVTVAVQSNRGRLDLYLYWDAKQALVPGPENPLVYYAEDIPTGKWNLDLPAGSYILEAFAQDHSGSFSIQYFGQQPGGGVPTAGVGAAAASVGADRAIYD